MILKVDIIFFFFGFVEDYSFFCNVFEYELSIFHVYSSYALTLKVVISRKKKPTNYTLFKPSLPSLHQLLIVSTRANTP